MLSLHPTHTAVGLATALVSTVVLPTQFAEAQTAPACWGSNTAGQLNLPLNPDGTPETFIDIVAGNNHALGLRKDGTVAGWGNNGSNQCDAPEGVVFTQIAAGFSHSIGLGADGVAFCWGSNGDGQCNIPENETFVQVAAGAWHSIGLRADGTAIAWGWNPNGQCDIPEGETFVYIDGGSEHSIGLRPDGSVLCWGSNSSNQCDVPPGETFVQIQTVSNHSIGLRPDGIAVAWGYNNFGGCDVPEGEVFDSVGVTGRISFGIRSDGTIVIWGEDYFGETDVPEGLRFSRAVGGSTFIFAQQTKINNTNLGIGYDDLSQAIASANTGDTLDVFSSAFNAPGVVNANSKELTFHAVEPIEFGAGLMFLPGSGTSFLDSPTTSAGGYSSSAQLIAPESGQLIFSSLEFLDGSQFHHNESSLLVNTSLVTSGGATYLSGDILAFDASSLSGGVNRVAGDTNLFCNYTNAGSTIIQRGILYIYGDLVNTGTITGEFNNGFTGGSAPEPGDGFSIGGNYTIGSSATLSMPNPVWWLRVGGNLDIAIDDPSNFLMSEATIELNGLASTDIQTLEALSADFGPNETGFDPSNFPIGTLRITGDSTTQTVNNHANATNDLCEVLYIDELIVSVGGSLITNDCPIYVRSATIDGDVDDPSNIIVVREPCVGDLDGNGLINGSDLATLLGAWGTSDSAADLNGSGMVDGADLAVILGAWGACR